ncbi:MAG: ATP-dependent Clp protease adaptor ClpS [Armatimonadetes bacterium]|nr:ATP-dependent Clp protease adaptor ClpS [Armatimonadota bacterium]
MTAVIQGIDLLPAVLPAALPREAPAEREAQDDVGAGGPYVVIVYDDDWHTFEQVEIQLQKATGCTLEKAEALSHEIDGTGRAIVFAGTEEKCEQVAGILRQIRLQVETDRA